MTSIRSSIVTYLMILLFNGISINSKAQHPLLERSKIISKDHKSYLAAVTTAEFGYFLKESYVEQYYEPKDITKKKIYDAEITMYEAKTSIYFEPSPQLAYSICVNPFQADTLSDIVDITILYKEHGLLREYISGYGTSQWKEDPIGNDYYSEVTLGDCKIFMKDGYKCVGFSIPSFDGFFLCGPYNPK